MALRTAISIGKQTYRTIKQNFFWALSYNLIAIPIAATGNLKPIFATVFMAFSDIVVIGNSILLKIKRRN
jgi:Cu+-exporting ATPase